MRLLLLLLSMAIMGGCGFSSNSIPGSGVSKREARDVNAFNKVAFVGGADLKIVAGAAEASCALQCDENLLRHITTEVVDGELRIQLASGSRISPTDGLQVEISVPSLTELQLTGVTTTSISGIEQAELQVKLDGSHELECAGDVGSAQLIAVGDCKIRATQLNTKSTSIEISGGGTAEVQASETLTVEIAGSGTVRYLGDPLVKQRIAGNGKIEKLAEEAAQLQ